MHVVFRTDASSVIGVGHIMRCLTFAKLLTIHNFIVSFLCREMEGNMCDFVEDQGFRVSRLPVLHPKLPGEQLKDSTDKSETEFWLEDVDLVNKAIKGLGIKPDWLIVDHYDLDYNWETRLRNAVKNIMVIDDLADRPHDCDLLLDQNYYVNMESRYDGLIPEHCTKFIGPQYLLLRKEFDVALNSQAKRDGSVKRIFVFFGGGDASKETIKFLRSLPLLKEYTITVDVVVGQSNVDQNEIRSLIEKMPSVTFHCQINNIAELMMQADLAVIAAGGTIWEACYLSLPAITIMTADNQFEAISSLGNEGILWNLGWNCEVTSKDVADAIRTACLSPDKLIDMGDRAKQLVGNSGGLKKVFAAMKVYEVSHNLE